jgi:signal peptidase I
MSRSGRDPRAGGRRRRPSWWQEGLVLVLVAFLTALVVKTFLLQMFFVPSVSMRPGLAIDDRILVEKPSTWDGQVERGDVVVFRDPGGWLPPVPEPGPVQQALSTVGLFPEGGHLVKRVIGLGGDRVVCCDAKGRVTVNGTPLRESDHLLRGVAPSERRFDVRVPADRLWLMGDNRPNSEDSRAHQDLPGGGTVPADTVVGRVWAVVWPWQRFELLDRPETFTDERLDRGSAGP